MDQLRKKARELLESGAVKTVIGYGEGSGKAVRAVFIRQPEQTEKLILDERCRQNLAVYLLKPEVKNLGKPAVVARLPVLRSILELAAESQLADEQMLILGISPDGQLLDLAGLKAVADYVSAQSLELPPPEREQLEQIEKKSPAERWNFWQEEFSRCVKCYACRASCPLCYCSRCAVECNQPQWISSASHARGNLEWHLVRAMHLAGRCVNCGDCARACPVGIPLNLLTRKLGEEVFKDFGLRAGTTPELKYALATFLPEDQEDFIR